MSNIHKAALQQAQAVREKYHSEWIEIGGDLIRATPVSFRSDDTNKQISDVFKRQNFIVRTGTVNPIPGTLILWNGDTYEIVRDREGSFSYNDEYQLDMVIFCVKRETNGPS